MFRDYNSYDRVHFGDLKILPRDQQYVSRSTRSISTRRLLSLPFPFSFKWFHH